MKLDFYKNYVIKRSTSKNTKLTNLLRKAIAAYEKGMITADYLTKYFNQLKEMEK